MVTVYLPNPLRKYCQGRAQLDIAAGTVRSALAVLEREHETLYRNLCHETGALRRHLNVFINADNMRDLDGIDTPLKPGDEITIVPAVSGG